MIRLVTKTLFLESPRQSRVTMVKEAYEAPAAVMTKHQQKKVQKDAKQRFKSGAVLLGAMWKSHPTSRTTSSLSYRNCDPEVRSPFFGSH